MSNGSRLQVVCDCPAKDALICKEHPDCRPSYCKMRLFDPPIELAPKAEREHDYQSARCWCGEPNYWRHTTDGEVEQ